jgi:hypothetical protein
VDMHSDERREPCERLGLDLGPRLRGGSRYEKRASRTFRCGSLGRKGSNLRMPESKSGALPLGDAPLRELSAGSMTVEAAGP